MVESMNKYAGKSGINDVGIRVIEEGGEEGEEDVGD